jgi:hypothetical protein
MYGEALAVPYGLSTSVSAVDPAAAIERLSGGSVVVVRLGDVDARAVAPAVIVSAHAEDRDVDAPERDVDTVTASPQVAAAESSRRSAIIAVTTTTDNAGPDRPSVERPAARREEVTIPGRVPFATIGGLALADDGRPSDDLLPEIDHLRRRVDPVPAPRGDDNVSLIIDATTDLSARAMRKVRRAQSRASTDAGPPAPAETPWTTVIGDRLRGARLRAGLDVDQLAERTRIRPYVIESMEADDFTPCGGDFYARGHLRTLARCLAVDAESLVADYDATFASSPVSPREVFEVELATGGSRLVRGGERSANWAAIVAAVLVLALVWGVAKFFADAAGQAGELSSPTQTATGLGSPGPGNPPVTGPVIAHVKVTIGDADTRVVVRDRFRQIVFEGVMPAGASRKFSGESPLRVKAADGGQVTLSVRGKPLGLIGESGLPAHQRVFAHTH